jgi:hypothetical protein
VDGRSTGVLAMAGKGDRMRRVNGPKYRTNYDSIKWVKKKPVDQKKPESK